jgi:hypothetical protein
MALTDCVRRSGEEREDDKARATIALETSDALLLSSFLPSLALPTRRTYRWHFFVPVSSLERVDGDWFKNTMATGSGERSSGNSETCTAAW